ncbi:MAG: hypothetical protein AAF357_05610 [Verrucomicrobiota bacterium]
MDIPADDFLPKPEWMSPKQVAHKCGASRSLLYAWTDSGESRTPRFMQRHGKRLVNVQSVREFILRHISPDESANE